MSIIGEANATIISEHNKAFDKVMAECKIPEDVMNKSNEHYIHTRDQKVMNAQLGIYDYFPRKMLGYEDYMKTYLLLSWLYDTELMYVDKYFMAQRVVQRRPRLADVFYDRVMDMMFDFYGYEEEEILVKYMQFDMKNQKKSCV